MILIDGPDHELRREVRQELSRQLTKYTVHLSGMDRDMRLGDLVTLLNTDQRHVIRDGLRLPTPLTPGQITMLTMGLASAGSIAIWCGPFVNQWPHWDEKLLPVFTVGQRDRVDLPERMVELAQEAMAQVYEANRTWDFASLGGNHGGQRVMLVGESSSPFAPVDKVRRMAFFSAIGCSRFLHEVLQDVPGLHYLTNAKKFASKKRNQRHLEQEIYRVQPVKIVGMGEVAHRMLADVGATFTRTYHPQYWARFRRGQRDELAAILSA